MKNLFENQRRQLDYFFDQIDHTAAEKVLERLLACKGSVIFSGVGKSGHIAEKVSATFLSLGTRSFYLNPLNALHGDIGFVSPGDLFIGFSKSGNSQELLELVPHLKKKGASTVAVVSSQQSKLSRICDFTVVLPVQKELCPHDLAPTTSTAAQLIFGDCLAVAYMQAKNFSIAEFSANHPGGFLGKKITLKVADLMLKGKEVPVCSPHSVLADVLHELSVKRCGCLLVADEMQSLKGIFTDGDLRRAIQSKGPEALRCSIAELMTPTPKTIDSGKLAFEAMKQMEEDPQRPVTVLPVIEEGKVIGLLRMHDILQAH
jgi:arabinose-5-phosphate isomerase